MTAFRLNVAGWSFQVLGTVFLLLDSIRVNIRLPREGIRLGDPPEIDKWIYHWASSIGFGFLLCGFVLCGVALWGSLHKSSNTPNTAPERQSSQELHPEHDIVAWQWIRYSVGVFDSLVMTLLTQGTIFVFAAFGVIIGNKESLGTPLTVFLCSGVFFAALMLNLGVWRYTYSIQTGVDSTKRLETRLFGESELDPRRITHRLAQHPLAAARPKGVLYYHIWATALSVLSLVMVLIVAFA